MSIQDPMLCRMFWKEYRAQRGFWLVIAGSGVAIMLLFLAVLDEPGGRFAAPWIVAICLTTVYALGCSAVVFASEREDGTDELLRIMAARTSRVFFGKVGFSLVSTFGMSAVLLAAAWLLTWGHPLPSGGAVSDWQSGDAFAHKALVMSMTAAQFLAWGLFFSAVCRKALTAVCLAALGPFFIAIAIMNISATLGKWGLWAQYRETHIWYYGLAPVIPLIAAAYYLTQRTIAGRTRDWSLPRLPWRSSLAVDTLDRLAAARETVPAWRRTLQRLIWLELKHALTIGHVLWIGGVYALVFYPILWLHDRGAWTLGIVGVAIVPLFMGVWAFQAESGRRIRFLADHGLSPQFVWLSKQIVWGLLAVALTIPFLVAVDIGNAHQIRTQPAVSSDIHSDVPGASAATFAALLACAAFGAGQFASMLIGRSVTAGFVGFALFAVLAPWTWFMIELRIPVGLSVVPLFGVLIATTAFWSRHWLLEQATAMSWIRMTLFWGMSIGVMWAGIGVFRVYEVPRPDFLDEWGDALRDAHGLPITPDEAATATLYREALSNLKWEPGRAEDRPVAGQQSAIGGWEHATESEKRLLAENQGPLREVLAASARPRGAFIDPTRPISELQQNAISFDTCRQLATLILLSAREFEAQGQLDEALDRYAALLRMARHFASRGTTFHWSFGYSLEQMVNRWISVWATHPAQTPEQIEAGARRMGQEAAQFPSLRDAVLTQQFMVRRAICDDWLDRPDWFQTWPKTNPDDEARTRMALTILDRCCPWERARALRVLDLIHASQLHSLDVLEPALAGPGHDLPQCRERADAAPEILHATRTALRRAQGLPVNGLALDDFFAPQAVGATSPERVPWNWLKTTYPLNSNPMCGRDNLTWIWQLRLMRELSVRTLVLRMKLAAYRKAHGEYPEQLDVSDFGNNAIDPYTGAEFGYRREGFHFPIRVTSGLRYVEETVPAGQPILWSAGPGHARLAPRAAATNDASQPVPVNRKASALVFTLP